MKAFIPQEIKSLPRTGTKGGKLLNTLYLNRGGSVDLYELGEQTDSRSVHSLVSTLRHKHGWNIENRQYNLWGNRRSEYRLVLPDESNPYVDQLHKSVFGYEKVA